MKINWQILDKNRIDILPKFSFLKEKDFYLAGGTGLALCLGHRDSVDFDFFSEKEFDTNKIFEEIKSNFLDYKLVKVFEDKNTLHLEIKETIKVSFFYYQYSLLFEKIKTDYFEIASVIDIACMKLTAITSRGTLKDYVDLYFILQEISLKVLIERFTQKYSDINPILVLKSLVYFDDLVVEPILYKTDKMDFEDIKKFLIEKVGEYQNR